MSKKFMKIAVVGDDEDLAAFRLILQQITRLEMMGTSRDITVSVDGDGSAGLGFYDISDASGDKTFKGSIEDKIEFSSEDMKTIWDNQLESKRTSFGITGSIDGFGDSNFSIGE